MSKRETIMQTTLELVAERGFHNAPTALIAQKANAAEGTIFRHFKTKELLLAAVFEDQLKKVKEEVGQKINLNQGFKESFLGLGLAFRDYYLRNPKAFLYVELFMNSPFGREDRHKWLYSDENWDIQQHPLIGFIELGKKQGAIKPLPNVILLSLVYAPLAFLLKESIINRDQVSDKTFKELLATCWEGISKKEPDS